MEVTNGRSKTNVPLVLAEYSQTSQKESWLMAVDKRGNERVSMSKWTLAAFTTTPAIATLLIMLMVYAAGWVRSDATQELKIQQMQNDVHTLKEDTREIKKTLQAIEVKEAYKLGGGTSHENEKPKEKK